MKCLKHKFKTKQEAGNFIIQFGRSSKCKGNYCRIYFCNKCLFWHFTRKEEIIYGR